MNVGGRGALARTNSQDSEVDQVDIVVVDRVLEGSHDGHDTEGHADRMTSADGSERESTRYGDSRHQQSSILAFFKTAFVFSEQFFFTSFQDPAKERHYSKESWFLSKRIAIWTSIYFYIAWILVLALYPRPWHVVDYVSWTGILTVFTVPLLPAVLFDLPSRRPWLWRIFLFFTTWSWSVLITGQLVSCGYYSSQPRCYNKDFVGLFYYLIAMPTMSLFALRQSRVMHLIGMVGTLAYIAAILIPLKSSWIRHFFNFLLFHCFVLYISYAREKSDRKIFNLRDQLKAQYKATQKAQVAESRASDMKKRFVNYIFHEVRVPLNTSLLAIQNLIGEDVFKDAAEDQVELVDVLQSSLGMMEKVLNDVLDFNRMEAGKLLYATSPFEFTRVIRSIFLGLGVAASMKNVELKSCLDPRIEQLGDLLGDEMRLRQILSNLTSNACKFTSQGGSVTLITKLLLNDETIEDVADPHASEGDNLEKLASTIGNDTANETAPRASAERTQHQGHEHITNRRAHILRNGRVTIRMEVHDTGVGIRPEDVRNDRLFSPYVQTEIGKRQGGKGTGLGLALVRNIVQLSGGRLGLKSTPGEGSVFWVELQFALADPSKLQSLFPQPAMSTKSAVSEVSVVKSTQEVTIVHNSLNDTSISSESIAGVDHARPRVVRIASEVEMQELEAKSTIPPLQGISSTEGLEPRPILHQLHSSEIELVDRPALISDVTTVQPRPFSPADASISAQAPDLEVNLDDAPLSILVVDDDLLTRRLMSRMITRLGHKVESAENGQLALDAIRQTLRDSSQVPFDLVFLDNQMPVLSGVEMVTRARMEGIETMIVGITGNAMKEDQDEYLECGADHVLIKPVMEANIKKMIELAKTQRKSGARQPTLRAPNALP